MASKMSAQHLQKLRDELQRVQMEIRSLQGQEVALKMAISVVSDEPTQSNHEFPVTQTMRRRRSPLKDIVLRLIGENAERGLVAVDLVDIAKAQGHDLDRNSVSSLLSRFKREGVLEYDGKVYRPTRPFPREVKDAA
ncbi:MAG: hypothetical protein WBQ75_07990 [Acetobacteraceae bacterium]